MSNSNKKIKFFTISLLCIFFILSIATILSTINVSAETAEINTIEFSKYTPTINDDFADNKVIVTLKPEYSDVNKNISVQKFSTKNILTNYNEKSLSIEKEDSIVIKSIKDLTYIENPSIIKNRENFSQTFAVEFKEHNTDKDHGTHVAGIIGAITNNNLGIAGIAPAKIALLNRDSFVESLMWAISNDIKIINASFYWKYKNSDEPYSSPQ